MQLVHLVFLLLTFKIYIWLAYYAIWKEYKNIRFIIGTFQYSVRVGESADQIPDTIARICIFHTVGIT